MDLSLNKPVTECSPTWADIYDPAENPAHMRTRWVKDQFDRAGHFAHYEPYGRGSAEKKEFMGSMNSDHEVWSNEAPDQVAAKMGNILYPRKSPVKIKKRVHFDELGQNEGEEKEFKVDGADRTDRVSWRTSMVLAEYVEKAMVLEERERFFDYGGIGRKFVKDMKMAEEILKKMEGIEKKIEEDDRFRISLADVSVKEYPETFFREVLKKLREYIQVGSRMNWAAEEFVPKGTAAKEKQEPLLRTTPKKICGVYLVEEKPGKPNGIPPKKRPKGSEGSSTEKLFWSMKSESDKKIEELNHKIDLLIQMGGPVVTAEQI